MKDVDSLTGEIAVLKAVLFALIDTHTDKRALAGRFTSISFIMSLATPQPSSDAHREAKSACLDEFRRHLIGSMS